MGKYFGTDGFRGEANKNLTFEHAIKIGRFLGWYYGAKDGKKEKVIASYYVGIMNFENTDESEITAKDFEASQQGTDEAVNWLQSEYEKLKK